MNQGKDASASADRAGHEQSQQAVSAETVAIPSAEYRVELTEDKPASGMWHCGPNAAWVTVTHIPTMISARAFCTRHWDARKAAQACCEMMVEQSRLLKCRFPERVEGNAP